MGRKRKSSASGLDHPASLKKLKSNVANLNIQNIGISNQPQSQFPIFTNSQDEDSSSASTDSYRQTPSSSDVDEYEYETGSTNSLQGQDDTNFQEIVPTIVDAIKLSDGRLGQAAELLITDSELPPKYPQTAGNLSQNVLEARTKRMQGSIEGACGWLANAGQ
jgi:hypothetical protein